MKKQLVPGIMTPRLKRRFEALFREKRGAAAVEFALIATPFFFLIFGLIEVCVLFIMSSILEHATTETARLIRTGKFQNSGGGGEAVFKNMVCDKLFDLLQCDSRLRIDTKVFQSFTDISSETPLDGNGDLDDSNFQFNAGDANDIVVVRVFYQWSLITPGLSTPLINMSNNRHLLQATAVFRNEPFDT